MVVVWGLAGLTVVALGLWLLRETAAPPPRPDLARDLARPPAAPPAPPAALAPPASTPPTAEAPAETDPATAMADTPGAETATIPAPEPGPPVMPPAGQRPRVAIVIDDLGRSVGTLDRLAAIGVPLTYAVLPFESRTAEVVAWLRDHGGEVLCHLPMEPSGGQNPGPGALYRSMSVAELTAATRKALDQVPIAVGANNHMGSGFSAEEAAMRAVLGVLAERDLFYLDSRTTPDTVGFRIASSLGLRAAERQVFLDNVRDDAHIRAQFDELLNEAIRRGSAVAIAHPYPETIRVLGAEASAARERGFVFVTASSLARGAATGGGGSAGE